MTQFKEYLDEMQRLDELLSKDSPAAKWIHDFVGSDNPKFKGKSRKERIKMALGAYYAKQHESVEIVEDELDEAVKLNSKVTIHAPGKDYHGKVGHVGEIRHGAFKGAPKTYTVDYDHNEESGRSKSVQLDKKNIKLVKEDVALEEGAYEKSEENKRSADSAKKQGDQFAYHLHMADHHDNLAQWHGEKGRHGEADKHAAKSEEHHELAMKHKNGVAEATEVTPIERSQTFKQKSIWNAKNLKKALEVAKQDEPEGK